MAAKKGSNKLGPIIKKEMAKGHPQKQAIAIAFSKLSAKKGSKKK
jgi:hypothetical protein